MQYRNQLEPNELIHSFQLHPPYDFKVLDHTGGLPAFSAKFDLLTTAEDDFRQKITRMPLYHLWKRWLSIQACFIGTTVSEYALFPHNQTEPMMAASIQKAYAQDYTLTIVKDIPLHSPLLSDEDNHYAENLLKALQESGFIVLSGQALAWVPIDFSSIDEYIQRLSSGRRKDMRRKLRKSSDVVIQKVMLGDASFQDEALLAQYYELYLNVFQQSEIHFDQLSREFFIAILQDQSSGGIVFTYYHQDQLIGYNICYEVNHQLIDKYVGFVYPQAREKNLYYLSWFHNLEYALDKGLTHYIAGWTDPEIKSYLGASFTLTQHAVYVKNPILRAILKPLSRYFESDALTLDQLSENHK